MRVALAILAIVFCLFLMQAAARFGFSRLLARYALVANFAPAADEAVRISPSDPDVYRARAIVFTRLKQPEEAVKSLERATSLRYRDDFLWIELGNAHEEVGDTSGAIAAMDQAIRWAPHYAHTHWQRGNVLLRMGRTAEAFSELRTAVAANNRYLPNMIDLAWGISRENLEATEKLLAIKDDAGRLALIRYLANKGKGKEAIAQMRLLSTPLSKEDKDEVVGLLFAAKAFNDAFKLWTPANDYRSPSIFNAGFEDLKILSEPGFGGWFISHGQGKIRMSIDVAEKFAGTKSLQLTFDGEWNPGTPLISQTILVNPNTIYPVSFSIKTKELATGGPLLLTVNDAASGELLGKSENFPSTNSWVTMNFEFTTLETSKAAVIRLQRSNCNESPCPIFGTVWLDEISIGVSRDARQ
jgi:carbohydrate binding protein with CBM4/9 domain/tetratricopeptide repeat protein